MGKGRPRAVEKGVLGQSSSVSSPGSLNVPPGPVYYPTEDEFKDPLEFIYKIRPEAERYGICKIVPPKSWNPPFALDLNSFTFPTKTQALHQLQARPAACDPKTFELEYDRFLEEHCGRKVKKKVVFEGEELDLCKLFNAVKRFGGYDKVVEGKKWGEVFRFVRSTRKISECAKHVLCQLYREHLYDYENYYSRLNQEKAKSCKRGMHVQRNSEPGFVFSSSKRRRKNMEGETVKACKIEKEMEELDQICEQCRSGLHGEVMLLCDRCNKGWHVYCLSPPLKRVPPGNWYCLECLNSDKDSFGFVPGKHFSLEVFRRVADRAKRKWFGSTSTSRVQLEKKFWEIVEGSFGEVEVMYGSDLDTSKYGSGFPRVNDQRPTSVEAEVWDEFCASPWNINNLPKLQGSMLRVVPDSIAGVMVPWLYIGMLFSSFCWHFEDHCFYSMNYLHWGEPKCWYSVPGSKACAFEKVMRKSLPDLFDVQPDLLFQLVTMLNPSVLQENGVPVYSILQEPGNFVITFPRSFHGGFNLGLNCAEAVNFAPADWLPHGGFGAELYQLYHKTAVLSHEELVCVVAKSDYDSKALPYLSKELLEIYKKEKKWREQLWRNGIVNSSPMSPRKHPEYVGTEEDPTCIICNQYLYLSAVVCRCRPSAFVCLQHWEHLCECKPKKHCILYRHTLAELSDLVLMMDGYNSEETPQNRSLRRELLCSNEPGALTKKVKGGHFSLSELAEQWLSRSYKILQIPYSNDAYVNALKEAEQFLWAGSEMDPVRDMAKNLIEAQNWAENIKDCLSKVEKWSCHHCHDIEKVQLEHVNNLLGFNPLPCNEPGNLKLKDYEEEAGVLIQEIDSALSSSSKASITDWEVLYSKVRDFPIYLKDSEKLARKLSFAKVWIDSVRRCISEKHPATIELDILYKLKSEISELQVQLPEADMLLGLMKLVESCCARCSEMLKGPINIKRVEVLLQELDRFTVNIPELNLLRQYHSDAVSWLSRFNAVLMNINEREDQEHIVEELICIQKDATLLKIQVDELPCVEIELKKACCRVKALKALGSKMSLDFIQQLMKEATVLQIEKEKFFVDISGVLATAMCWEEKAAHILGSEAQMPEFENVIRTSEDIFVILPSLDVIKDAVSMAKSWLQKSKPYLEADLSVTASSSPLKVEALKELVSQSKLLKVSMGERTVLQTVLKNCIHWEHDAYSLLRDADCLLHINTIGDGITSGLILKIELKVAQINSIIKAGLSLRFEFGEIPKLQDACSTLQWCFKALSFCSIAPPLEEVEMLMQDACHLPSTCASSALCSSLIDAINWLKKALEIPLLCNRRRFKLDDVKEILWQLQRLEVSFPVVVCQLATAIEKHNLWLEKVHCFFSLTSGDRTWFSLLQLKELGSSDAFNCPELDMVLSEVQKVEQWKQRCKDIVGPSVGDVNMLLNAFSEIETTLDRSLNVYGVSTGCKARDLCMCCSSGFEDQEFLTCSLCKDCYHLECLGQLLADRRDVTLFICRYCQLVEGEEYSQNGGAHMKFRGKRPELSKLIELSSEAEDFCVGIEERIILCQLVGKALACKAYLTKIVDFVLDYLDEDLSTVAQKLSVALKAVETAGVYDHQGNCNFEMAIARNSWRVRANKLLEGSQKPVILEIQCHLKEGLAINISPEDHFMRKLTDVKHIGIQWADKAKKVSMDSGALALDKVFELITEGESLTIHFEEELKLLRDRSMLYCICRKPYDQRAMIACDKCDEWYHFDCIKLSSSPKIYICPACKLKTREDLSTSQSITAKSSTGSKFEEPQTPSPRRTELRRKLKKPKASAKRKMQVSTDDSKILKGSNGIECCLLWRNRKPFRRSAKKRAELDCLSTFFHV